MRQSEASLSNLPRFPLSVILAYLQQPSRDDGANAIAALPPNRDALALLLAARRLARALPPLFRVPEQRRRQCQYRTRDGRWIAVAEVYRFAVLPVQDPGTLLARLNTRRLRGRVAWAKNESRGTDGNGSDVPKHGGHRRDAPNAPCYQHGRSTEELALEEWTMMEIDYSGGTPGDSDKGRTSKWRTWPAHLELLQFLDSEMPRTLQVHPEAEACRGKSRRRGIPSPFPPFSFLSGSDKPCNGDVEDTMAKDILLGGRGISILASYPRSGNTLLRTLLERITSIVTGSDTRPDRTLSKSLAVDHGLVGEGLVGPNHQTPSASPLHRQALYQTDPLVHVVKTHFPERRGWRPIRGRRVVLLVRNPFDAIDSYWNLCCTNTHTRTLDPSVYAKYARKFEELARHEIKVWVDFHHYWMDACEREGAPLLVVRYEDLILDTAAEMRRVLTFLLGRRDGGSGDPPAACFWEWRLRHVLGNPGAEEVAPGSTRACTSNLGSYRPRSSDGGLLSIGKSIRRKRYPESVVRHMHDVNELARRQRSEMTSRPHPTTLLQQFGYDIHSQQFPDNFGHRPAQPPILEARRGSEERLGTVTINQSPEIRDKDDPFGRAMTFWRRGETDGDAKPFPTIPR